MALTSVPLPSGFELAVAKAEDYEAVMEIDKNIYDGVDYLPKKYMEYIKDPRRLCLLGRKDGKVVAFSMSYIVDEGKSVVKQALRVHPDYQGRSYISFLQLVSMEMISKKHKPEQIIWTSINREVSEKLVEKNSDISVVVVRPRFSLDFSPLTLERTMKTPDFLNLIKTSQKYFTVTATPDGVRLLIPPNPQDVAAIVPEGFWVVNWEPYQTMASNYDLITKDSTVHITMATGGLLLAISYGTPVEVKVGLRYRADYYVRPEYSNDKTLFVSHLMKHLNSIHLLYKGDNVSFSILYPQSSATMAASVKEMFEISFGLRRKQSSEAACLLLKQKITVPEHKNPAPKL